MNNNNIIDSNGKNNYDYNNNDDKGAIMMAKKTMYHDHWLSLFHHFRASIIIFGFQANMKQI